MKKVYACLWVCLLVGACATETTRSYAPYGTRDGFIQAIERGDADADRFVHAARAGALSLRDVSPEALANYLEAFANEGMLGQTPPGYMANEEMKTSLEVVFESLENVSMNRKIYQAFLKM
jgi:hypothetical protein